MLIALMPLIIKIVSMIVDALLKNKKLSNENREILTQIAEKLRLIAISNVKDMHESESQIEAGNQAWDEREAKLKEKRETKK